MSITCVGTDWGGGEATLTSMLSSFSSIAYSVKFQKSKHVKVSRQLLEPQTHFLAVFMQNSPATMGGREEVLLHDNMVTGLR